MIVDVEKYVFIGAGEDLDQFFAAAQKMGTMEFIAPQGKKPFQPTAILEKLMTAFRILSKLPKIAQDPDVASKEEIVQIAEEVLSLKEQLEVLNERQRTLQTEIIRVAPLGDFILEEIEYIERYGHRIIRFFCRKSAKKNADENLNDVLYLGTEYDLDYYMSISKTPLRLPHMMPVQVEYPVGLLKKQLEEVMKELEGVSGRLKSLATKLDLIDVLLVEELNVYHLDSAKSEIERPLEGSHLFSIFAWIPQNKIRSMFSMLDGMAIHAEKIEIDPGEKVPTYMENRGLGKVGEDLVHIYDTPSTKDKDPSYWVLSWFAIFFAMIIADAGYGMLFLTLAVFLKVKKRALRDAGRRFLQLLFILSFSCITWGVLSSAYFGVDIVPTSRLSRISLVNYLAEKKASYHFSLKDKVYEELLQDYPAIAGAADGRSIIGTPIKKGEKKPAYLILNDFRGSILLELSLLTGVIHLCFAMLRYALRNWAGIGWITFIVGGYLYFPSVAKATSLVNYMGWMSPSVATHIGLQLLTAGIVGAMMLALLQKGLKGIGEIMQILTVFADVLSYLRLYALALASTIMAETFNAMGEEIGIVLGGLVILVGHSVNLLLATMGGVIHGLRLNFLEWYHYCFEGGGRLFAPLKKRLSRR